MTIDGKEPHSAGDAARPGESEGGVPTGATPPGRRIAEDLLDQAEQYALGARGEAQTQELTARMVIHEDLRAETERLLRVTDELLLLPKPMSPRRDLWPRIQARLTPVAAVDPQIWKRWQGVPPTTPVVSVAADQTPWEATGVAGIEARRLFTDAAHKRVTMMVRMAPGSAYPAHRHADVEECYVLQGDLDTGTMHMHGGDYQRAEKDSVHPVQTTRGGCLLLLVSSQDDELI